jgi:hypothetical protein
MFIFAKEITTKKIKTMKTKITRFVRKTKYYIYVISLLMNIPFAIEGDWLNIFAVGWCAGLLFCSLVNDEII